MEVCPQTPCAGHGTDCRGVSSSNLLLGEEAFFEARELEGLPAPLLGLAPRLRPETLSLSYEIPACRVILVLSLPHIVILFGAL